MYPSGWKSSRHGADFSSLPLVEMTNTRVATVFSVGRRDGAKYPRYFSATHIHNKNWHVIAKRRFLPLKQSPL